MFISVLFPAPFSPSRAWISPDSSSKATWSFATTPGNALTIPLASTAGVADACGAAVIGPPLARCRGRGRMPAAPISASARLRRELRQLAGDAVGPPVHADLARVARCAGRELLEIRLLELGPGSANLLAGVVLDRSGE